MDLKKYSPVWRPYDHNLRAIAAILAEAGNDGETLARVRAFLETCGVSAGQTREGKRPEKIRADIENERYRV